MRVYNNNVTGTSNQTAVSSWVGCDDPYARPIGCACSLVERDPSQCVPVYELYGVGRVVPLSAYTKLRNTRWYMVRQWFAIRTVQVVWPWERWRLRKSVR